MNFYVKAFIISIFFLNLARAEKPNVLFIFTDDQMWNSIGALEDCPIKTPNLDRLKEEGAYFSHAYNMGSYSAAVCISSRTMLITGQTLWNAEKYAKKNTTQLNIKDTWPQWMKTAGYETYMAGKWHVNALEPEDIFDYTTNIRPGMPKADDSYNRKFKPENPDGWAYNKAKKGFWEGGKHWSEVLADDGEVFLKQAAESDKPFFMYLAFNAPHDPRQAPKKFVDMYDINQIKVQENFLPEYPYNSKIGASRKLRDERLAPFPRTEHSVKVNLQEYYALITHLDEQVGRILVALEATGKADNTYIFFTSDHGLAVGDHGFMGKQNMYDASMRVGIQKPKKVQFNSMMPLATGKTTEGAYGSIYGAYFGHQRMYRTDKYKMIIYPKPNVVRLYDMVNDPLETKDLAEGADRPVELMDKLFAEFQALQETMNDSLNLSKTYRTFMKK